jgi:hypothetical protein
MPVMMRFVKAPNIAGVDPATLKEFIGLEVPINNLEIIGLLGAEESTPNGFDWDEQFPEVIAIETSELVLSAVKRNRLVLSKYLMTLKSEKILVEVGLCNVF